MKMVYKNGREVDLKLVGRMDWVQFGGDYPEEPLAWFRRIGDSSVFYEEPKPE